jgi:hypothetical protein
MEEEFPNLNEIFDVQKIFTISIGSYSKKKNEIDTTNW